MKTMKTMKTIKIKKLLLPLVFLFSLSSFSQTFVEALEMSGGMPPAENLNGTNSYGDGLGNSGEWSKMMGMLAQFDDIDLEKRNIKGSIYLFDTWENNGEVILGKKKYLFNNINYHIEKDAFMTKIDKDSTFILNKNSFTKVLINGRSFKYFEEPNNYSTKLHEMVYDGKNISLLKAYSISFIERSKNPMVNRPDSEIKQKSNYYLLKKNKLIPFKLKKSNIKYLVEKNKIADLKLYIKNYRLSFKSIEDLKVILKYCDNL